MYSVSFIKTFNSLNIHVLICGINNHILPCCFSFAEGDSSYIKSVIIKEERFILQLCVKGWTGHFYVYSKPWPNYKLCKNIELNLLHSFD